MEKIANSRSFKLYLFDNGWKLGLVVYGKAYIFDLPVPLKKSTILYSLKRQGFWKSLKNRFFVNKVEQQIWNG